MEPTATGYAPVNGMQLYWESYGDGGVPLVVVHGGFGVISMFRDVLEDLATRRRVVAVELQGHGHTRDIDRRFTYESFGDDVAGLVERLELGQVNVLGYSLGAGTCLRAAIQHPDVVSNVVSVSFPFRREGWYPEVLAGFDHMGRELFEQMQHSPMYEAWRAVAPDPDAFPTLMDKTGELLRRPYDWSEEIRDLKPTCMLVYGDADSVSPHHIADFYALLGGGLKDAVWDGAARSQNRLAVLPGRTHYDVFQRATLVPLVNKFLG